MLFYKEEEEEEKRTINYAELGTKVAQSGKKKKESLLYINIFLVCIGFRSNYYYNRDIGKVG